MVLKQINDTTPAWTAADFLSTWRYWALFLVFALVSLALGLVSSSVSLFLATMRGANDLSSTDMRTLISELFNAQILGRVVGSLLAIAIGRRHVKPTLMALIILCGLFLPALYLSQTLPLLRVFFFMGGITLGALDAALLIMVVFVLTSGRPDKGDIAFTFGLLALAPFLLRVVAPLLVTGLYSAQGESGAYPIAYSLLVLFISALVILLTTQRLAFDDIPRARHVPLTPTHRSAWIPTGVGLLLIAISAVVLYMLLLGMMFGFLPGPGRYAAGGMLLPLIVTLLPLLGCVAYMGYWFYRIHGELAALIPAQRLLTPGVAATIVLVVPFGMPIVLLMLRDALNEHLQQTGDAPNRTPAGFIAWVLIAPVIATGFIQHWVNGLYENKQCS
jgi:MFS family permease